MSAPIDRLIAAVVRHLESSGLLESRSFMGVVSAVGSDGTLTVTRAGNTYPKVRRLSGYTTPAAGDRVIIQKTASGWICLGELQT